MTEQTKKPNRTEREAAWEILLDMDRNGRLSSQALEDGLRKIQFEEKGYRAFISRLVEGTTEYRLQLDAVLDRYARMPMKKQKPKVRCLLRMSVYQMLYMDSVPDRAIIHEAGQLMRSHHLEGLQGVVNGILRNVQRGKEDGTVEQIISSSPSIRYSTPEWLCRRLEKEYGAEQANRILAASFTERPLTVRCNCRKQTPEELLQLLTEAGVAAKAGILSGSALQIEEVDFVRRLPGYRDGRFSVQDESSMCTVEALELSEGEKVLDVCSAPGGKACYAADLGAVVTARDLTEDKTDRIRENAERLELSMNIEVQDALELREEDKEAYDVVIADVPCSGLGVMGRKNDIKYHVTPEGITDLAAQGQRILDMAEKYVRPGGKLLFSTCTILEEENGKAKERFLADHPGYIVKQEKQFLQGVDPCDGFYFCLMEKKR